MAASDPTKASSIFEFQAKSIDGEDISLSKYKGFVTLIVNVASKGLTELNYAQLADLHTKYAEKGLRILAFPCNQFGNQEPGTDLEIKAFALARGAHYDLFSKIDVNGDKADPLYKYLKSKQKGILGNKIKWNFSKFICDKNGIPVKRYAPTTEPLSLVPDIEKYLCQ
ncbi:phospholipid hydroperoxide glutathione peroxidase, mitochondrial-like [Hydra vulgaris]|uniref:Glutathione peroxidase n=1 Tax=Hydra vulgaris TaxID=6087 RepID=D9I7Q4_HYDVU|nr:phospholipid hydroperoxide glutathione peroxidase, mitochondrial-like [Hydra vulgaris]ADI56239.1 glutathione peroxidase [Hydra vulgaris]